MAANYKFVIIFLLVKTLNCTAQDYRGAVVPWSTYEAENMITTGMVIGPKYDPYRVETESSGQKCVKLTSKGQFVEFISKTGANSMVIRYSIPDNKKGNGLNIDPAVYQNGRLLAHKKISSRYSWLYGKYPFTNNPQAGDPRNFYDEIRIKGLTIKKGDSIRIQCDSLQNDANYCIIDLVDLENIALPLRAPAGALWVTDKRFLGNDFSNDYTKAFRNCIAMAAATGKTVWIPAGIFRITGDIVLPANINIQGAGMWHTVLTGNEALYGRVNNRVRLKGAGNNIHISDFAIIGKLNYRSDKEANDGIVGSFGINSTISRIWIEHTKVGMWLENSRNLKITDCRIRNTIADGINFCVGMNGSTIANCTARGTGDDCFAIWPTTFTKQEFSPGHNVIIHCTARLPFLANGSAIYGGQSNEIKDCSFVDISQGSAILISTTFPTENKDKTINNNFSGTTVIENCDVKTSGGFDHEWNWRAALEICLDKRSISGIKISNLDISNSLSNAISVIAKNEEGKTGILSNASLQNVNISNGGIGVEDKYGLFISNGATGTLTIRKSNGLTIKSESSNFNIAR
jgi:hypothetical protein